VGVVAAKGQRQRIVLWTAVLGAAAAFAPAALADDATQPPAVAVSDAAALVESALEAADPEATLGEVDVITEVVEVAEAAVQQVPTEPVADVEPATPTAETVAPSPAAPAAAAETAVPAPETPVPAPEPAAEPAAEPAQPSLTAVTQQVQPVNVNVAIRFESPGDNGPVSQVNAAIANVLAEVTTAATAAPQYQPAESQYQAPAAPVTATTSAPEPAAPETPTSTTSAPAPAPTGQWDWTWQWSCGEAISPEIVLPANSLLPIWNWNWDWNCGGDPSSDGNSESQLTSQYQATATQYQPMNVNISIRILSPGNDGPVTQTNVAQANVAATIVSTTTQLVTRIFHSAPAPGSSTTPAPPAGGSGVQPAPSAGGDIAGAIIDLAAAIIGLPAELAVEVVCCELVSATPGFGGSDEGRRTRPAKPRTLGSAAGEIPFGPTAGEGRRQDAAPSAALAAAAPVTPEAIAALAPPRPAVEAARRAQAQEQLKKRAAQQAAPIRDRATALSYAGMTPLGAPDRSFKLYFLFLIPFAFALVDAARRVLGEQTPTAADPGRPEERPG
jgi:hypothetical protein